MRGTIVIDYEKDVPNVDPITEALEKEKFDYEVVVNDDEVLIFISFIGKTKEEVQTGLVKVNNRIAQSKNIQFSMEDFYDNITALISFLEII